MGPDPAVSPLPSLPSLSFCPPPLVALPASPYSQSRLTPADAVRWQYLVSLSLVSSSFLSPVDGSPPRVYLSTITFSASLFPSASPSTHLRVPLPTLYASTLLSFSLSKYILHGDKCKTKTYLSMPSVNMLV